MREQAALDEMRIVSASSSDAMMVTQQSAAANFGRQCSALSRLMISAIAALVASGSARSFISGAASPMVLQKASQNFCSSAPQATSLPSRVG